MSSKEDDGYVSREVNEPFESQDLARSYIDNIVSAKRTKFSDLKELDAANRALAQISQDYAHRVVFELIQNAADANGNQPIGYKGIGFRSVLTVTDAPRIHSGHLHVRWSPKDAHELLGFDDINPPVLEFPKWCNLQEEPEIISQLAADFATVIVLPLREDSHAAIEAEWKEVSADLSLLLFLDSLDALEWKIDNEEPKIWRRERIGDVVHLTSAKGEVEQRWRLHKTGTAVVAMPLNESGEFAQQSSASGKKFRCFFPTDDLNPFPSIIVHNRFPLQANRKHINLDDKDTESVERCFDEIARALCAAVEHCPSLGAALDLLRRSDLDVAGERLWVAVKTRLCELRLSCLEGRKLTEMKACPQSEYGALPGSWRDPQRWWRWEQFKSCLIEHRTGGLEGLPFLPLDTENSERETTLIQLNASAPLRSHELRLLPWAMVEGQTTACESATIPIFESPENACVLASPPAGISIRFLNRQLHSALREKLGKKCADDFLRETLGVKPFDLLTVINETVLPVLSESNQPEGLLPFLKMLWEAAKGKRDEVFDWTNETRAKLIHKCKVSCRDGGVRPAFEIYAGREWTDSAFLDECYDGLEQRGFLHAPPDDGTERKGWESFYRWLGIGWSPKVIPVVLEAEKPRTHDGLDWLHDCFVTHAVNPVHWSQYCAERWTKWAAYTPKLRRDWTIDGDAKMLCRPGAFDLVTREWTTYVPYASSIAYKSSNRREDRDDESVTGVSYLFWLFKSQTWIPAGEEDLLCKPEDVFLRGEVLRALGDWVSEFRREIAEETAAVIGLREYWKDVKDEDWRRWLKAATQRQPSASELDQEAIRRLYRALLNSDPNLVSEIPFQREKVWWIERGNDRDKWELASARDSGWFYLDRPQYEHLRLHGLFVFPVRLDRLESKAEKFFGMRRLSDPLHGLQGAPVDSDSTPDHKMQECIHRRLPYLLAYLALGSSAERRNEIHAALNAVRVETCRELKVRFSLAACELATIPLASFPSKHSTGWIHFRSRGEPHASSDWERLAETLLLAAKFPSTEKAANVRDMLTYEESELPEKLINLGVSPDRMRELRAPSHQPLGPTEKPPVAHGQALASDNCKEAENTKSATEPVVLEVASNGTQGDSTPPLITSDADRKQRLTESDVRPHPEAGAKAEKWLRDELKRILEPHNWSVSHGEVTIPGEAGRTDALLTSPSGEQIHVEVKHIKSRKLFWRKLQIEKAGKHSGKYFIALVQTEAIEADHDVFWVWDPLVDLASLRRSVEWTWKDESGSQDVGPDWEPTGQPPRKDAQGYKIVISIDDGFLSTRQRGIKELLRKLCLHSQQ